MKPQDPLNRPSRPDLSQRMKSRFPEFDAAWNKLLHEVGPDLVNYIQEKIDGQKAFLGQLAEFKFKFVVDNNFVFGQIKGAISKNKDIEKSFIYKLLSSKSIQVYAPPLLKEELLAKINLLIPEENCERAIGYALMILSRIEIKDAQWVDNWKKANNLIGEIDNDDVPYLALALEIESHAIMTLDEVFHRQGEIRVWKHADVGKVISNYNSGFISLLIFEQGSGLLYNIASIILRFIRDIVTELIEILIMIASGALKTLSGIPWPVWFLIVGLGIAFWDDISKAGKDIFTFLKEKGSEILARLKAVVLEIYDMLKGILEVAGLAGTVAFEFMGYLLNEYNNLNDQLKEMKFDKGIDFTGGIPAKQA
jgi:predicted nucleic acid-binding protein